MANEIKMFGFDELMGKINGLKNTDAAVGKAIQVGAEIIKGKVKPKIPRSDLSKEHAADHIEIGKLKKTKGIPSVVVGPDSKDYFYLLFYEFGTKNPNALGKVIPALHMFSSTVSEEKGNVKAAMIKVLKEEKGL